MKKITLLLFLTCISYSFGQVLLDENFDAALTLPIGWTNNDILATGDIWTFQTGGFAPFIGEGNQAFYSEGGFSGNFAILNSDAYGAGAQESALESPEFDCTGLTTIKLSFNNFFVSGFGGVAFVEVYNGTTWTTVTSYSEPDIEADTFIAGPVIIDVSNELANISNAKIRFRWIGDYSYYWAVDNIVVQQPTGTAPDAVTTPTPANGAEEVAIDTSAVPDLVIPFEWLAASTGDPATSFDINLGVTPTGDDIGTVRDFNTGGRIRFAWEYSTLYYWSIDAVNIAGSTPSAVWSFTTEANPSLSVDKNSAVIFSVYPNPVKDKVKIITKFQLDTIEVVNQLGQQVLKLNANSEVNNTLDLDFLDSGIYYIKVNADNKTQTVKIIKQ